MLKKVLVFGDSLADGILLDCSFFDVTIAAHHGATTEQLLHVFPSLCWYLHETKFDWVVVIAGTNDLGQGISMTETVSNLTIMSQQITQTGAKSAMCTLIDDDFNELLWDAVKSNEHIHDIVDFLDEHINTSYLQDDGVHLNEMGRARLSLAMHNVMTRK
jgi:hypothetical protein